jgi:hypothetical protein
MKVRDLSFVTIVVFVIGGTQALSRLNRPPAMPGDLSHQGMSREVRAQCLGCHQFGAMLALERRARHPAKWRDARFDCLLCHLSSKQMEPNRRSVAGDNAGRTATLTVNEGGRSEIHSSVNGNEKTIPRATDCASIRIRSGTVSASFPRGRGDFGFGSGTTQPDDLGRPAGRP